MNQLPSLVKLETRIRLLIDELKVVKEHLSGGDTHSVETSNKLAQGWEIRRYFPVLIS